MILLDQQTPDPTPRPAGAGGAPGGAPAAGGGGVATAVAPAATKFVEKILQASKPSLYGDNQAIFSVQLEPAGVTLMEQALRGQMTPIGIIYQLDYVALRPAFLVKLSIQWDRVFHYIDQMEGVSGIFVNESMDKMWTDLKDQKLIVLEADNFVPESEDAAQVQADFAKAEAEVRTMITDAFFKPALPDQEAKDGWDKAKDALVDWRNNAITGGIGSLFSYSKKDVDITHIDQKSLNVTMNERTAVRRSIYPQGHISGLAAPLNGDPGAYLLELDLNDAFFARRKVTTISRANLADDQLASVHVYLNYAGTPHDVMLDATSSRQDVDWPSALTSGVFQWPVTYNYDVTFQTVDTSQRPMQLSTRDRPSFFGPPIKDRVTTANYLEIVPREDLYTMVDVPIYVPQGGFPWSRWAQIEVDTFYSDPANGLKQQGHFLLDANWGKQADRFHWKIFVLDASKTSFQYRLTFFGADGATLAVPLLESTTEQIRITDPFPMKRAMTMVPVFDWTKVSQAFCDIDYEDPGNAFSDQQSFMFDAKHPDPQNYSVDLRNPSIRQVGYQVTVVFKDGHQVVVPPSFTLLPRVMLRDNMRGHQIVAVHTDQGDFAAVSLTKIDVDLKYSDSQVGISAEDVFTLKSAADNAHFEFDYVDPQRNKYQYQATYSYDNGMIKTTDWAQSDMADLVIPVN
jgi:hypothetical protein